MSNRTANITKYLSPLLLIAAIAVTSCHSTRHLGPGQYLLKKNGIVLRSDKKITSRGEIKDNLSRIIIQKPNHLWLGIVPMRLYRYNQRYDKWHNQPVDSLPKKMERPAIVDTALMRQSAQAIKNAMTGLGYFYAIVKDTFIVKKKKAYATYTIDAGYNFKIGKVHFMVEDSAIAAIVREDSDESVFQKGVEFRYPLLSDERSRLTALIKNHGYYKFTQENIDYQLDTGDKSMFKDVESPFEGAVNYTLQQKKPQNHVMDIDVHIRKSSDTNAFKIYKIESLHVYPDFAGKPDLINTVMILKTENDVTFKYHKYFVHPRVLYEHIYLNPGSLYSQSDYDKTTAKLRELGMFELVLPALYEKGPGLLSYDIYMKRTKKHDFIPHSEVSTGSTYSAGASAAFTYRDRNLLKGSNLLTIGANYGIELAYNGNSGQPAINRFSLLTGYYGINTSIDFPKFLAPIGASLFSSSNLPHTIISGGENVMDRYEFFTLVNTSANFYYSWKQTETLTWNLSPAFINIIRLPQETDSFQHALDSNAYLRNSYKQNFIEGEYISLTYDDSRRTHNYSYLKVGLEEAGGILGGLNTLGAALNDLYKIDFAQYVKFDFDARHYFTFAHSSIAMRFYGGLGLPYGQSVALPYIKQYFAGGPYGLRGWRVRSLGPGSNFDNNSNPDQIDRTGDIKLEYNTEYRFPIAPLFAGAVKMNGAVFADAGNIWLAKPDPSYPGGEFSLNTFGQDIAADVGVGARFDIATFLTLRADVAMPVKEPYVQSNGGWVFNQIDPYSSGWRASNIVLNISIGYPF